LGKRPRTKRLIVVSLVVLAVVALLAGGTWVAFARSRTDTAPDPGQIVTAFVGDLQTTASASGSLIPQRQTRLSLESAGRIAEVLVQAGDTVREGQALVRLDDRDLQLNVLNAEQDVAIQEANLAALLRPPRPDEIEAARAAVESTQAQLEDLLAGPSSSEIEQAKASLQSAQAQLEDLLAGPDEKQVAQAKAALASAEANLQAARARYALLDEQITVARRDLDKAQVLLDNAQYFYDALTNDWQHKDYAPFSPEAETLKDAQRNYDVALAAYELSRANINDSAVRSAELQVAQARANLAALTKEKTAQIASARAQVAQATAFLEALTEEKTAQIASAREQLAQAQAALESLTVGPSDEQLASARAQLEQARISLAEARDRLANATLLAPFDGVVTAVHVAQGEWASGLAVEMIDPSSLEVVLDVDEIDVGNIHEGQAATVTLEPWPDSQIPAQVLSIAPKARVSAETVTYEVHLALRPGNVPVRTGMTANAELVTSDLKGVLLVPNRAVISDRQNGKYYVDLLQGDQVSRVEVRLGARNASYTQVIDGLSEGDRLVIGRDATVNLLQGRP